MFNWLNLHCRRYQIRHCLGFHQPLKMYFLKLTFHRDLISPSVRNSWKTTIRGSKEISSSLRYIWFFLLYFWYHKFCICGAAVDNSLKWVKAEIMVVLVSESTHWKLWCGAGFRHLPFWFGEKIQIGLWTFLSTNQFVF